MLTIIIVSCINFFINVFYTRVTCDKCKFFCDSSPYSIFQCSQFFSLLRKCIDFNEYVLIYFRDKKLNSSLRTP